MVKMSDDVDHEEVTCGGVAGTGCVGIVRGIDHERRSWLKEGKDIDDGDQVDVWCLLYEGFYNFSKVCCPTDFALNIST